MRTSRLGFTLIELLVVIAIIALLAVILFPVFAAAREKARQASCASNLKQLGLALIEYSSDYDECAPFDHGSSGVDNVGAGWACEVYPYVKAKGVYTCPDDTNYPTGSNVEFSYLMNLNIIGWAKTASPCVNANSHSCDAIGGALTRMTAPASTIYLFEGALPTCQSDPSAGYTNDCSNMALAGGGQQGINDMGTDFGKTAYISTAQFPGRTLSTGSPASSGLDPLFLSGRHSGGSNFLMCDGHVKWLKSTSVSTGQNPGNGGNSAVAPMDCTQDESPHCYYSSNLGAAGTAALTPPLTATFSTY